MPMPANEPALLDMLKEQFAAAIQEADLSATDPWIQVAAEHLPAVAAFVRDHPQWRMEMLNCITGVDYWRDETTTANVDWQPHIELLYHLSSLARRSRLMLKVVLPRWTEGQVGQLPEVPTVSHIWRTAEWHEREVFDLVGVQFVGHPDLRRILCAEDWVGHPLRKDYQPPAEYRGIPIA